MKQYRLLFKLQAFYRRIVRYFRLLPVRFVRFWRHIIRGLSGRLTKETYWKDEAKNASWFSVILFWLIELVILLLELLGFGELYETINDFFKYNSRPLTRQEIDLAKSVFGDSIDYEPVRIDEKAYLGPRYYRFCYVSFSFINSWNAMPTPIFIHEMMHIWQYQHIGAIYTIRALIAQYSECGYDYGGVDVLRNRKARGAHLLDFNYEQQGDIITDYFLLKNNLLPQWDIAMPKDLPVYESYIEDLFL